MLDEFAARDPRLRVMHLPVNVGLGQARNVGIEAAQGTYVWFVDSDDWLAAGAIDKVLKRLDATDPDVLVVDHLEVYEDRAVIAEPRVGRILDGLTLPITLDQRPGLLRIAQSACTRIVRRSLLASLHLRFAPGWYEDSYFSHALMMAAKSIDGLGQPVYCYRRTMGTITTTRSVRHFEVFEQYDRLFAAVEGADRDYDGYRGELFRIMVTHMLVILGNRWRLPRDRRREFFQRMSRAYAERRPASLQPDLDRVERLKYWLVERDSYTAYRVLRRIHLVLVWPLAALREVVRRQNRQSPKHSTPSGLPAPRQRGRMSATHDGSHVTVGTSPVVARGTGSHERQPGK